MEGKLACSKPGVGMAVGKVRHKPEELDSKPGQVLGSKRAQELDNKQGQDSKPAQELGSKRACSELGEERGSRRELAGNKVRRNKRFSSCST